MGTWFCCQQCLSVLSTFPAIYKPALEKMPWFWFQIASLLVISERIVLRKIWEVHLVVQWSILPTNKTEVSLLGASDPLSLNLTWALREWGDPRAKIGPIWIWPLFQSQVKIGVSLWHMRSFTSDCIITCTYRFIDVLN